MVAHVNTKSASISVSTSSARTAYPAGNRNGVTVYNAGAVPVFVKSGSSSVVATTTDQFVPAGYFRTFEKNPTDTHLAAIAASDTSTVYFNEEGAPWN